MSNDLTTQFEISAEIVFRAIEKYKPYAIIAMVSGGNDSLTAYAVARRLGVKVDFIMHGHTGTGIQETTDYVRSLAESEGVGYIEADAGRRYEDYLNRKGFFGVGALAHSFAYHVVKHGPFRSALSRHIRQRRRGRNILLLNGIRSSESDNRKYNYPKPVNIDSSSPANIWVNVIHHWNKTDCNDFLDGCPLKRNAVTEVLCRSGECMCGTMQSDEQRREAAFWFPRWGQWIDDLSRRTAVKWGFGWGEDLPDSFVALKSREKQLKAGQLDLFDHWQPMCQSCLAVTSAASSE